MTDYTKEELEALIKDICPRCKEGVPLVHRLAYDEYGHTNVSAGQRGGNNLSHTICMATHLRVKYRELLGG